VRADFDPPNDPPIERASADDALDRVFELGATDRRRALSLALMGALLAHASMAGALRLRGEKLTAVADALAAQELSIEREVPIAPERPEPEAPPPTPPPEPAHSVPDMIAPAPNPSDNPYDEPASAAAQAGEVLVQDSEEEDETDDSNENTFVTGDAGTYAGGVTASSGTSTVPVRGSVVADGGVPGGGGTPVAAPKPAAPDLSRAAWLDGNTSWDDCDFPGEADRDRIRDALVGIVVTVRPNGTAQSVVVVDDPGHGFARTASACALKHTYVPALDRTGRTIWGTTRTFHVGFHR
jgi:periplasmic protein TonB